MIVKGFSTQWVREEQQIWHVLISSTCSLTTFLPQSQMPPFKSKNYPTFHKKTRKKCNSCKKAMSSWLNLCTFLWTTALLGIIFPNYFAYVWNFEAKSVLEEQAQTCQSCPHQWTHWQFWLAAAPFLQAVVKLLSLQDNSFRNHHPVLLIKDAGLGK